MNFVKPFFKAVKDGLVIATMLYSAWFLMIKAPGDAWRAYFESKRYDNTLC